MPILPRQIIPSDSPSPTPSGPPPEPSQPPAPSPSQSQPSTPPRPTTPNPPQPSNSGPSRPVDTPSQSPSASLPVSASVAPSQSSLSASVVVPTARPPPAINPNSTPVHYTPSRVRSDFGTVGTSSAEPSASAEPTSGMGTSAIIGIVVGGIAGMCIFIFLCMFIIRRVRRHRDSTEFDPVDFRRSALVLDDPVALPDDGFNHTFNPRPPTMIERKMNTAGVGAGPGTRGARGTTPAPPAPIPNPFNQFQEQYQGQYRDDEHANMGYAYQPQDPHYAYQPAVRQYSPPPPQQQPVFGGQLPNPHAQFVSTSPPPGPIRSPVHHSAGQAARAVSPQQRLVPGDAASPNRVSTATTYDGADPYGGI